MEYLVNGNAGNLVTANGCICNDLGGCDIYGGCFDYNPGCRSNCTYLEGCNQIRPDNTESLK